MRKSALLLAIVLTTVLQVRADASIRTGFDSNTLARNDDSFVGPVNIGFTANFFGVSSTTLFVNNNGNVTFDSGLRTFTPFNLTSTGQQIIAPFFADVDTRGSNGQPVTYGTGTVDGRDAFGVNWVDVAHFSQSPPLNSFQLVLVERSDTGAGNFDIEFNYESILWESGEASGGDSAGLGGSSARVGFSNGTGDSGTFFELFGSAINGAFLDSGPNALVENSLNSNEPGVYLFQARNGAIDPGNGNVPEPVSFFVWAGLACAAGLTRRRLA